MRTARADSRRSGPWAPSHEQIRLAIGLIAAAWLAGLAAVAVVIWRFHNVHFGPEHFPLNRAWLTGRVSAERMRRHHPLEYERLPGTQEEERPTG